MIVPETTLRDPNLLSKSDLGAWQVAFQSSKCIDSKYIKYLLFTCLSSSELKLIKIGARVVRHARAITFQLAEVAVTGPMVRAILAAIRRLRAPPLCA